MSGFCPRLRSVSLLVWTAWCSVGPSCAADLPLKAEQSEGSVTFHHGQGLIAAYYYSDAEIPRPYFAHLHAPGGLQVSRTHPPVEGLDEMDHPTFHPGLWLAFGDLSGADNWRLKAAVAHAKMLQPPHEVDGALSFAVENHYLSPDPSPRLLCKEHARFELHATERGYLLTLDSTFFGDGEFSFGDQEEMGLGFRVATPLRVEGQGQGLPLATGLIRDSQGRRNATEVWGQSAQWIDYSGQLEGVPAGIAVFCHPGNFRPTRFHARDYGFVAANPFSDEAFGVGPPRRTVVRSGESLRLRYGVLLHSGADLTALDLNAAYSNYVGLTEP